MAGPSEGGGPKVQDDREATPPPLTKEQIKGHLSALRSIIKDHNRKNKTYPIQLDFDEEDTAVKDTCIVKGKEAVDDDLRKPFKEALKTPLTRRIIEFAGPEYKMPTNIKLYDGTTDPKDHLGDGSNAFRPTTSMNRQREAFTTRYSVRKICFKEPREITKIVRRANESLTTFKERWTVETGFIMGVPEIMKISSFMDSLKCPELAKRFSDKALTTVNEMMKRLDDLFVLKEPSRKRSSPKAKRESNIESRISLRGRDNVVPYRGRDNRPPYPTQRGDYQTRVAPVLTLDALTIHPKEILATETQLRLAPPRPMIHPQRGGNMDRICDYHQEKGHHTNDYHHLRRQLEAALESDKLNHLIKDVRQKGKGNQRGDGAYNITFEPRNAVKGQILADFITETPDGESPEEYFQIPKVTPKRDNTEEWTLFTDGASSSKGSRAGLVLIGPSSIEHTYDLRLTFESTNNKAEYEALLAGLRMAKGVGIHKLEAKVDSKLVASEINGNYVASSDSMMNKLASVAFNHLTKEVLVEVLNERSMEGKKINTVVEEEGDNWMTPIIQCLEKGVWPEDKNEARNLRAHYKQTMLSGKSTWGRAACIPALASWFGLPRIIVTDIGTQFVNEPFKSWYTRLNIQQMNTVVAHPQANRLVERANKSLIEGIKTRLGREKAGWVDELSNVLWAHQTSIKTSNGETPFSLTYGSEAVIQNHDDKGRLQRGRDPP
ncbi:reverse transcriptase domain-containing protein [Tanacetum coccineum]|uniref:Reverse transcriptase domain-containing protein n=1 Tax=Tanacetum coccineum TaxID=301880 RepID=A0ABQ5ADT8_9ASTR